MKKKILLTVFLLFSIFSITGCGNIYARKPLCRVVTGVDISCQYEDVLIQRHYTKTEKTQNVLNYLRLVGRGRDVQTDPEQIDAPVFHIQVRLSDGQTHAYAQKDHRYFYKSRQGWQTIDPEHAAQLYRLMGQQESDV